MTILCPIFGRGVAQRRLGAEVPEFRQKFPVLLGAPVVRKAQIWNSKKICLVPPPPRGGGDAYGSSVYNFHRRPMYRYVRLIKRTRRTVWYPSWPSGTIWEIWLFLAPYVYGRGCGSDLVRRRCTDVRQKFEPHMGPPLVALTQN